MSKSPIVVGVDGSDEAAAALHWAVGQAVLQGAPVVAVHAVGMREEHRGDPEHHGLDGDMRAWTAELEALAPELVERRAVDGSPVMVLLAVADEVDAGLIVVGNRGIGRRTGVLLGSTSRS